MKSTKELEQAAKYFIQKYKDKSNEKSSAQSFLSLQIAFVKVKA